jgi:hypothetical protein
VNQFFFLGREFKKKEATMAFVQNALSSEPVFFSGREFKKKEATMGFEPMMRVLQTLALPLGHVA